MAVVSVLSIKRGRKRERLASTPKRRKGIAFPALKRKTEAACFQKIFREKKRTAAFGEGRKNDLIQFADGEKKKKRKKKKKKGK